MFYLTKYARMCYNGRQKARHGKSALFKTKQCVHVTTEDTAAGIQKRYGRVLSSFFDTVVGVDGNVDSFQLEFCQHLGLFDVQGFSEFGYSTTDIDIIYLDNPVNTLVILHVVAPPCNYFNLSLNKKVARERNKRYNIYRRKKGGYD